MMFATEVAKRCCVLRTQTQTNKDLLSQVLICLVGDGGFALAAARAGVGSDMPPACHSLRPFESTRDKRPKQKDTRLGVFLL